MSCRPPALLAGNERYVANTPQQGDYSAARIAGAEVTNPIAAILSCSDSRVPAEIIFDQAPGDLFVTRVAGNVLNEDSLASLEYSVKYLAVPLLMVLGHADCGTLMLATQMVRQRADLPGRLAGLIKSLQPAVIRAWASSAGPRRRRDRGEREDECEAPGEGAAHSVGGACLRQSARRGALFDAASGKVKLL